MMGLSSIITEEIKKALKTSGITADVLTIGNELVVTIKKDDILQGIINSFPEAYRPLVKVEASDIKITIRIM
jgi:hypothetical protein